MKRAAARQVLNVVLVMLALAVGAAFGQPRPETTAVLSSGTVPLGDTFELRVSVSVPPRSAVYFPDKLPANDAIESHGSVRLKAESLGDGATLTLTYPLIALGTGNVEVPRPEVFIGPLDQGTRGTSLPGGSVIGAWDRARVGDRAPSLLASSSSLQVRVASIFQLEGVLAGVGPMPAADVVGRNWHLLSLVLLLVSSIVLIGVLAANMRKWLRSRAAPDGSGTTTGSSLEDARRAALEELDRLLVLGLHTDGRTREFYTLSSGIVRRYVQRLDARCGLGLTSTELMRDLQTRIERERLSALSAEMTFAEAVKFGRLRPESDAAEAHWRAVRNWIDEWRSGIREY